MVVSLNEARKNPYKGTGLIKLGKDTGMRVCV